MKQFATLFRALDATTRTSDKLAALQRYFAQARPEDAAWTAWFLAGNRPRRTVTTRQLRSWVAEAAGLPEWLVEESHDAVGDLGETLSLILDTAGICGKAKEPIALGDLVEHRVLALTNATNDAARGILMRTWTRLDQLECLLFHKMIGGTFRVGVSKTLLIRALADHAGVDKALMARRMMGGFTPSADTWRRLTAKASVTDESELPYPFYLASPLESAPEELGEVAGWQFERKWDGIRAQLIRRGGEPVIWSRGEEMIGDSFPEIVTAAKGLPAGTVLDGEMLAWRESSPLPFAVLQRRLGRRGPGLKFRREYPVVFMAYDLLEWKREDLRRRPIEARRRLLEACHEAWRQSSAKGGELAGTLEQGELFPEMLATRGGLPEALRLSPLINAGSWRDVAAEVRRSRELLVEGLMLKRRGSPYGSGRERGCWWKWKVDPLTIDAVLVAAQPGHGRRAGLFTDYTFAVWSGAELVTVAKAYSGLTDDEMDEVDRFVRANTTGRHGPVRGVKPELVFELAFEGVQPSSRHKSGVAVRFPRINRRRTDKTVAEADSLETLLRLAEFNSGR